MNSKQMLSDFQTNFNEFRESFHSVMNSVMNYEMTSDLNSRREQSTKRLEELDKLIEEKRNEINNSTLTGEELENLKQKNEALITGYNQEKDVISKDQKDIEKNYENDVRAYREELKNSIQKLRDSFGVQTVGGREISKIDILRENIKNQINSFEYQLVTLKSELDKSKDPGEIKKIANEIKKVRDKKIQRENFLDKLSKFEKDFSSLESNYVKRNRFIDVFDLDKYAPVFEELANAFDGINVNTMLSLNVIANTDGTYSLDMRCGNKIGEPRPIIAADKLNKDTIDKFLKGFIGVVASKTDLTIDDLEKSDVIVKSNGVTLGREKFENVGLAVERKVEKNVSTPNVVDPNVVDPNVVDPNVVDPNAVDPNAVDPNAVDPNVVNPNVVDPNVVDPNVVDPNAVDPNVVDPNAVNPNAVDPNVVNPNIATPNEVNPDNPSMIDYRLLARSSRKARFDRFRKTVGVVGLIACGGLGLFSGTLPALAALGITGGVEGATTVLQYAGDCLDKARQGAVKHKINKIAKKHGLNVEYDYQNGTVKYYTLGEDNEKVYFTSEMDNNEPKVKDSLDSAFAYINGANRTKEYAGNAEVTLDNLEAAFEEFGGLIAKHEERDELMPSDVGWKERVFNRIANRAKRARQSEVSTVDEVSIDETLTAELDAENAEREVTENHEQVVMDSIDGSLEQLLTAMEENVEEQENVEHSQEEITEMGSPSQDELDSWFTEWTAVDDNGVDYQVAETEQNVEEQENVEQTQQGTALEGMLTQDEINALLSGMDLTSTSEEHVVEQSDESISWADYLAMSDEELERRFINQEITDEDYQVILESRQQLYGETVQPSMGRRNS